MQFIFFTAASNPHEIVKCLLFSNRKRKTHFHSDSTSVKQTLKPVVKCLVTKVQIAGGRSSSAK